VRRALRAPNENREPTMSSKSRQTLFLLAVAVLLIVACAHNRDDDQDRHRHRGLAVTTYHYDNLRTGWNSQEHELTPAKVAGPHFGQLYPPTVLDDQVDAQPLVVPHQRVGSGPRAHTHDVVYVATEGNSVYAIDAASGNVLLQVNLGPPVPMPLGCTNNGPNVGINGTPVIDREAGTMYVMAYTIESGQPTYRLHALDLETLQDKVPPALVAASHTLTNGSVFTFNARYQRQRPALLLAYGNVYAGFGSFCDFKANLSRGWLLGWHAHTLAPLPANRLNDTQATSPKSFFLSSIWMSGYGVASDGHGHVYFVTGNSDWSGTTYDGVTNIQESTVKVSADLTHVVGLFTPKDQASLELADEDFGSGGVMLLPDQPGSPKYISADAGKNGKLYLHDRQSLGGYTPGGPDKVLGQVNIGGCWCGPSYYGGHGAHIIGSGGNSVTAWKLQTSPSFSISAEASSAPLATGQDPGFFTSVSSEGDDHAIVWAVSKPVVPNTDVKLYAFDASSLGGGAPVLSSLFAPKPAGTWPSSDAGAFIVPVVAHGKVFVASYKQLSIFGLK
jgi:hypothetical protein